MKKFVLFFLFLFALVGCSETEQVLDKEQLSENVKIAKSYLEEKGYDVISLVSDSSQVITQEYLETIPGQQEWNVQPIAPDKYIGKTIDIVMFVVEDHPLNDKYHGEIRVRVFLYEKEVIGGTSFAVDYDGGPHSLEGE
ncbi:hypothetical protein E3U55_15855 [Filobacillus milosensis]|uniref:DUF4830 domain-containing protein n=1 Tax=Filobacillus milosensis TaxID=94137 RepID=A0A4Y8IF70_9BACI|nr:hypothetical protein [Filobacillus milosensis]TFB13593.1 hypothetical protein E3U55_15855 [Filobacillus milosensis]